MSPPHSGATSAVQAKPKTQASSTSLFDLPVVKDVLHFMESFDIDEVTTLLRRAATFTGIFQGITEPGAEVQGELGRLFLTTEANGNLRGVNRRGGGQARLRFRWQPVAADAVLSPGAETPAVPLDPACGQRIEVRGFEVHFGDGDRFEAFGAGRTWPDDGGRLRFGAVLDVERSSGAFRRLAGTVVLSGEWQAPGALTLQVVARFLDPEGGLITRRPLPPLPVHPTPPILGTTMVFLGEVDPKHPVTLRTGPNGQLLGSYVYENLRLASFDSGGTQDGPRSRYTSGVIVGSVKATLGFNPLSLCPLSTVQTRKGIFHFHDSAGHDLGTLAADMTQGYSFRTALDGVLLPVFRFGGLGLIQHGTGCFAGARGLMTMNSAVSVFPRTLANLYILRFDDPDGSLGGAAGAAWYSSGPDQGDSR
jgi:hypothetical protein